MYSRMEIMKELMNDGWVEIKEWRTGGLMMERRNKCMKEPENQCIMKKRDEEGGGINDGRKEQIR